MPGTVTGTTSTTTTTTTREPIVLSSTSTSTSSSTGARARSIEANVLHGWYLDCCEYYADSFRREPAPAIRREIAQTIKDGMTGECLQAIIDETMTAPRPSWAYCRAIINRAKLDGIKTLDDWHRDKQKREGARNPALNYAQRQYQDDDFGPDFFFDYDRDMN